MPRDTTPTTYHSFARPELWANWADAWDYLVQTVDSHLLKTGPIADRPADPPTGSWYYATDDAVLYRYTEGGSWVAIAGTSAFNHQNLTTNPHGVTATQAGALPTTGGTVTGDLGVTGTLSAGEMAGFSIDTAASETWYRLGTIPNNGGANVLGFVTETSRTGNQHEGGMEWFKVKRDSGSTTAAFGGWHYQIQDPDGRTGEASVEYVDNGNGTAEVYYKAGPYTRGRLHIFQTGHFDADFGLHGTIRPVGAVEVQKQFPVAGDVTVGGNLDLRGSGSVGGTLSASDPTANGHLTTLGWINANMASIADLSAHASNTENPHGVTAAQAGALSTTGGTVTGDVAVGGALTKGGNAVATEQWVDTTADVPNADHADQADNSTRFGGWAYEQIAYGRRTGRVRQTTAVDDYVHIATYQTGTSVKSTFTIRNATGVNDLKEWGWMCTIQYRNGAAGVEWQGWGSERQRAWPTVTHEPIVGSPDAYHFYIDTGAYTDLVWAIDGNEGYFPELMFTGMYEDSDGTGVHTYTAAELKGSIVLDGRNSKPNLPVMVGSVAASGPITEQGNQVWHGGNFNPSTKADVAGGGTATLTGYANIETQDATVGGDPVAGKSAEYTTPPNIGTQKNSLSLTRAGGLLQSVGAIMPAPYSQPSIIHAPSAFDSPLAEWYVYAMNYSEHRNHLFYSDNIEGPYTDYGIVLTPFDTIGDQAEGPSVMHVPEKNQVWMYYHELLSGTEGGYNNAIQQTYLATAPTTSTATTTANGTSFTQYPSAADPEPILEARRNGRWDDTNLQYATMRRQGGQFYCIYRATDREANSVPFGYATSSDGIHWNRAKYPVGGGLIHSNWTPNRKTSLARLFPSLIELNGELIALWTQDGTNETRALSWDQLQRAQPDSWVKFADVALGEGDSIDVPPYTYILSDEFMYRIDWRNY